MKRKPSMRTKHNRAVKKRKHSSRIVSDYLYFDSSATTFTFETTGLVAGDIITIGGASSNDTNGTWTISSIDSNHSVTIGTTNVKSPKSVHPARRRQQAKRHKMWNTRIEQIDNGSLTFTGSTATCTKISDDGWIILGDGVT